MTAATPASMASSETRDRALLEAAARAAGMFVLPEKWPDVDGWFYCLHHSEPAMHFRSAKTRTASQPWRPLTDDGDAFRLAVKLGLFEGGPELFRFLAIERLGQKERDDCRAYRRAIVRAAAAITAATGGASE
jgi:hypothetical protein